MANKNLVEQVANHEATIERLHKRCDWFSQRLVTIDEKVENGANMRIAKGHNFNVPIGMIGKQEIRELKLKGHTTQEDSGHSQSDF